MSDEKQIPPNDTSERQDTLAVAIFADAILTGLQFQEFNKFMTEPLQKRAAEAINAWYDNTGKPEEGDELTVNEFGIYVWRLLNKYQPNQQYKESLLASVSAAIATYCIFEDHRHPISELLLRDRNAKKSDGSNDSPKLDDTGQDNS